MSKFYLWSIGNDGCIYSLSSWNSSWIRIDNTIGNLKQFKKLSTASWCAWSVSIDNELYIYIPSSDTVIRTREIIIESQRKFRRNYSSKHLTSSDPHEFSTFNSNGKLVKTDLKTFKLPSNRWKWENDWKVTTSINAQSTNEGWVYSLNFPGKFQTDRPFLPSQVRQRFWRRFRCFQAFDCWLQIGKNISPNQDSCGDASLREFPNGVCCTGIRDIGCGGEMLPHQKDGFLSVWVLSVEGQILYRLNVHRQNPEGSHWCPVKLPSHIKPISLAVGPLGSLLVCSSQGDIYFRESISWRNLIGTSWKSLPAPDDLLEEERIVQLSVSIYSLWARSSRDRLWSRHNVNLHESGSNGALGNTWRLVATDIQDISSCCSEQVFVLSKGGKLAFCKSSKAKNWSSKLYWTSQLPMESGRPRQEDGDGEEEVGFDHLIAISSSGLFLEQDALPSNWVRSPLLSHRRYAKKIDSAEYDWRIKITGALRTRDASEFKNPRFSHFTSAFEETFWSKASNCLVQVVSTDGERVIWLSCGLVLHHKVKKNITKATMHVTVRNRDLFQLQHVPDFIELTQISCVSKIYIDPGSPVVNHSGSGVAMAVFLKKEMTSSSSLSSSASHIHSILFKFPSESDVEDWIMAINFAPSIQNEFSNDKCNNRVWILNEYNEPFYSTFTQSNQQVDKWHQDGGHFRIIESGARGTIVWALGFNGVAWVHSQGTGGSYLSALCSSKYNLHQVSDSRAVYISEHQKLRVPPGELTGSFRHYMWTNDSGNILFDKEKVDLLSKRWRWSSEWTVCAEENGRTPSSGGWQYAAGLSTKYEKDALTSHTSTRRRGWTRQYSTKMVGPWKEIRNDIMKIIDISIYPDRVYENSKGYRVLAVSSRNQLLLRKGVTLKRPEGLLWMPLQMELKVVSVSINASGTVWVICLDGFVWRLKFSNIADVSTINRNDWERVRHPQADGRLTKVSSGSNVCVWVVDCDNNLWCRLLVDERATDSVSSDGWISVCDGVLHVSCGIGADSQISVWAVFTDGTIATRTGISPQLPQGNGWITRLTGIGRYVAINCA